MNYYKVTVTVINIDDWSEHKEQISFKSFLTARHMAKRYFACYDVREVVVTDETTGEVMYSNERFNGEFNPYG